MDIFYLKKSSFLPYINTDSLLSFSDGRKYASKEKEYEHLCGIFLGRFIAKNIFGTKNQDIETINGKPVFVSKEIHFNISHSKDIVLAAFNTANTGVDVEYMKKRDYTELLKRYGDNNENPSKEYFYRFWTMKEAEFKLGSKIKAVYSGILEKDYILTCVSDEVFVSDFNFRKIVLTGKNIDLQKELTYPYQIKVK